MKFIIYEILEDKTLLNRRIECVFMQISDGHAIFYDHDGVVAAFAPGYWTTVIPEPIEDEPPDAQWTPEELKRLKARDAPPLEINKINSNFESYAQSFDNTVVVDDDKTTVYDWLGNIIEIKVHSKDKP